MRLDTLTPLLLAALGALNQSRCVLWSQALATLVMLIGWVGWSWAAAMRRRERLRLGSHADLQGAFKSETAREGRWPGVSVVMPVKGCRPYSVHNWSSVLDSQYGGSLEFLAVVDAPTDPAAAALAALAAAPRPAAADGAAARWRQLVAPPATRSSQKIASLAAGVAAAAAAHSYVLMIDDDVALHPAAVALLVDELEAAPELFMATGYPLDLPPPGASLLTYLVLVYHLPLLIAFSVAPRASFVWGGCMLLRLPELRKGECGVLQAWQDGGYSDDLLLAAHCTRAGLGIATPPHALFAQHLPGSYPLGAYWNYLRRQLYVLDTYSCPHNRRINHSMAAAHAAASAALAAGMASALAQAACAAALWSARAAAAALSAARVAGTSGGGGGGDAWCHAPPPLACRAQGAAALPGSWWALAGSCALAQVGMWWMVREATLLLGQLGRLRVTPGTASAPPLTREADDAGGAPRPAAAAAAARPQRDGSAPAHALGRAAAALSAARASAAQLLASFDWLKLWAALLLESALLPPCMAYTLLRGDVVWSGVRYHKRGGRVVHVERLGARTAAAAAAAAAAPAQEVSCGS